MKKLLLGLCVILIGALANATQGLKNVIVEKYYVSDADDAAKSVGTLPVGSITYRIYVQMDSGYRFMMAYGRPTHTLSINTTTSFFNNEDRGDITPKFTKAQAKNNTVMLDSWLSVGAASSDNFGILKKNDDGIATIVNANGILKNADTTAGIALTMQDGFIAGIPGEFGYIGIDSASLAAFNASSMAGKSFTITNGSWYCLNGAMGPKSDSAKVLIAQITTDGELSFELNVQLRSPSGNRELYVAKNPAMSDGIQEIQLNSLMYSNIAVSGISVSPTSDSIVVGATQQLIATVLPSTATNKTIIWSSDKASVATVSSNGLVTGIAEGTAIITGTTVDGAKSATSRFRVTMPVTGVSVSPTTASIAVSGTKQITATVSPANATYKDVTWNSGKTSIATVSNTGLVTGVATGTDTITVTTTDGKKTAICIISVTVPVTGVSLNHTTASIKVDSMLQLMGTVAPSNATDTKVSWMSDKTSVATVSSTGMVTGVSAGTSTITATTEDGSKTATCEITVSANVSVKELAAQNIELYPNPVKNILTVKNLSDNSSMKVFDMQGRLVLNLMNTSSINVSVLNSGIYNLEVITKGIRSTHQFIKE
jgi:uncharacterized protein YjdB